MGLLDTIAYVIGLFLKFVAFLFALGYIAISLILFFALYGMYLFMNNILLGINYVIYGLNVIVTPTANFFNQIPKDINKGIDDIINFFEKTVKDALDPRKNGLNKALGLPHD